MTNSPLSKKTSFCFLFLFLFLAAALVTLVMMMSEISWMRSHISDQIELQKFDAYLRSNRCVSKQEVVDAMNSLGWSHNERNGADLPLPVGVEPKKIDSVLEVTSFGISRNPGTEISFYFTADQCMLGDKK